jgi:predicted metal-dependent RNase
MLTLLCLDYIDVCQKNGRESYPKKAVEKTVKHSIALDYGEVSDITSDMRLTLQPSGHLLGSSLVHLHVGEGLHNILYTGDLKFGPSRLFEAAYTDFSRAETVIIESTYGASKDNLPSRREAEEKLMHMIDATVKQGGKVLIPSFAVGRGQEIMTILAAREFQHPVWLEGMIWDATAIHTAYPEHLNHYVQKDIFHRGKNPFLYEKFHRVVPKERNDIIDNGEPGVVIATSGMLIGGPAIEYLKGLATGKKNTLLFVGYQGEGTPGRRIQKGWREVPIYGNGGRTQTLRIEMNVDTVSGLTGHSDRSQLMSYLHKIRARPERILIQHGEASKCLEFARDAHRSFRTEALAPKNLESVRLN